ncbi:secretin N-terminal domain-containing protein [Shewanella sp. FJAT-52076]|uniref:secretin N-terminal domain-containing protein n=1 Tax=Shewanella sp. FJAT-52076 TaxID=2864202 RepID=UPI001C659FEE|nr:secretin N-terminal domain-containing protein [Shewanella sp. FJAT-52076]QYJ74049.1 hypothetical protein K0H79_11740 [Shewanella sp. FJAT-52076]
MPFIDFIHYVFGELLGVNYIVGEGVADIQAPITLSLQERVSPQKLVSLAEELLLRRNVEVKRQDNIFYVHKLSKGGSESTLIGYGRNADQVPLAAQVQQIAPLKYLYNGNTTKTITQITGAKISPDVNQGVLFITGERDKVIRALELLDLLDSPNSRSKHVGFLKLTFVSADDFITDITEILKNEGVMTGSLSADNRVAFVPLQRLGAVAVFAAEDNFISRIQYWATQLDKPSKGNSAQYFIYSPKFARASDLGQSMSALLSGRSPVASRAANATAERTAEIEGNNAQTPTAAASDTVKMVVDDRANSLIFQTTGAEYQALLPMIERLDVMPKQVMLEVAIMEVTLTDEFKYGVDIALSSGKFSWNNAFGAKDLGGSVLKWVSGENSINAQAFESNKWVNVLSKPTVLVRDGMTANIQVGTDIPVVGKTTTDPTTGVTRSVEYRKTGINVKVTPTVNAQGVVIMTIDQSNSNQVDGGAEVEGNPQIFERSLSTEVVAQSGRTVVLGGLVSENNSDNESGTPVLKDIPLLGGLFSTTTKNKVKTELVIMVTPKVISRTDEWDEIKQKFDSGLEYIKM